MIIVLACQFCFLVSLTIGLVISDVILIGDEVAIGLFKYFLGKVITSVQRC